MKIRTDIREFSLPRLRVGVLSDSQLNFSRSRRRSVFERNLLAAFRTMKKLGVTFILFAGDICNTASKAGYRKFVRCLAEGYDGEVPPVMCVMGNHDYYLRPGTRERQRRLFERELGQNPYAHFVVNGCHFIGASPDCGSMSRGYERILPWLETRLSQAEKDGSGRPVFVLTHNSPRGTVYGSGEWGDDSLAEIFAKHPRVVNFAGHTHYSPLDPRIMWRGEYTAFGTGSTSYVEMEKGKANGSVPPEAHTAQTGWVLDIEDDSVTVALYNMKDGRRERPVVNLFPDPAEGYACPEADVPVMSAEEGSWREKDGTAEISFPSARGAHSYRLVYSDGSVQEYFSDFWKGGAAVTGTQTLTLYGKSRGIYQIKVYAVNPFGKTSDCCTVIKNVEIRRKRRYRRRLAPDVVY